MTALAWLWTLASLWLGLWLLMREVEWFDAYFTNQHEDRP